MILKDCQHPVLYMDVTLKRAKMIGLPTISATCGLCGHREEMDPAQAFIVLFKKIQQELIEQHNEVEYIAENQDNSY